MRLEAIYDDGRLELPAGVLLKHSRIRVTVLIPDEEIAAGVVTGETGELPPAGVSGGGNCGERSSHQASIREAIDEILGPWKRQIENGPPLTAEDRDRLRYEALEEKYLDRR